MRKQDRESRGDPFLALNRFDGQRPAYRALQVYAIDPGYGRRGGNHLTLRVPFEPLQPGPIGARVAVVDQDLEGKRVHTPVDLDNPALIMRNGLEPSDSNPHFHQQMVYAVVSNVLHTFDRALGREARFRNAETAERARLTILPHGMQDMNSYYDHARVRLAFGQFPASEASSGRIIPGQPFYTCLSHNVVVHEATHALLD